MKKKLSDFDRENQYLFYTFTFCLEILKFNLTLSKVLKYILHYLEDFDLYFL